MLERIIKRLEKHPVATSAVEGSVIGYSFVSPLTMYLSDLMHQFAHIISNIDYYPDYGTVNHLETFEPEFFPWAISVTAATSVIFGVIKRYSNKAKKLHHEKEEELFYRATHDCLTDTYNRMTLESELEHQLIVRDNRTALFFIDADGFKKVNDEYSHEDGDEVLKIFAERIKGTFRKSDYVYRYGGDEFIVLMNYIDRNDYTGIAERLLQNLSLPYLDGKIDFLTGSVGIAVSKEGDTAIDLISKADACMYAAKKDGKNKYFVNE